MCAHVRVLVLPHVPQEYFIKYYDSCMPLMTNILTHASGEGRTVRSRPSLPDCRHGDGWASRRPSPRVL